MLQVVVAMNSHENKAPEEAVNEAAVVDSSQRMKKVSVDTTEDMSTPSVSTQQRKDRMSWQDTCWDDMYEINTNTMSGRRGSRRRSSKSELSSSSNSFYQPLSAEADESLMREISGSGGASEVPIIRNRRKSMQKCLEEDEEAFANSLRSLALEIEKKKEKDAILCNSEKGTSL
jgi:hypothetical protein